MGPCTECRARPADMYAPDGAEVCKGCFYTADARSRQAKGASNLVIGGWVGIGAGVLCILPALVIKHFALLAGAFIASGIAGIRYGRNLQRVLEAERRGP